DDVTGLVDEVAHDLPADRGIGIEQPVDDDHVAATGRGSSAPTGTAGPSSASSRNARTSARSSMSLWTGFPRPWPASVSMRMTTGASPPCAAWSAAANLKEWPGTTRSSWSPVVTRVGGYAVPG